MTLLVSALRLSGRAVMLPLHALSLLVCDVLLPSRALHWLVRVTILLAKEKFLFLRPARLSARALRVHIFIYGSIVSKCTLNYGTATVSAI